MPDFQRLTKLIVKHALVLPPPLLSPRPTTMFASTPAIAFQLQGPDPRRSGDWRHSWPCIPSQAETYFATLGNLIDYEVKRKFLYWEDWTLSISV